MSVACPFGNFFTGSIIDKYGRRTSLIWSVIPSIIGWFLLIDAKASLIQLYLGRLLTGFALGASSLPSTVYATECITINSHHLKIRGSWATWSTLALSCGVLLTYGLGAFLPYTHVAFLAGCFSVVSLVLILLFIPESPSWLHRKGRIGDAELAQRRLGIKQPILLNRRVNSEPTVDPIVSSNLSFQDLIYYIKKIKRQEVYKPLCITISFLFFTQFSGYYCLTGYMVEIIGENVFASPYYLSVISGLLQLLGVLSLSFLLPFSGIKTLSVISTVGVSGGFALLGISEVFKNQSTEIIMDFVHLVSVWLIIIAGSLGLVVIPYSILGEMFPMEAKGYASVSLIFSSTFNFIILKVYPSLHAQFGGMVFFAFALITAFGTAFVIIFLPETVGKTMDEIKSGFKSSKGVDSNP